MSLKWLKNSETEWKGRHAYRDRRVKIWRYWASRHYKAWLKAKATKPTGHTARIRTWQNYERADQKVDKWLGLRDEAAQQLRRRRRQIAEKREQTSDNFDISEFDCNDGTPVPVAAHGGVRRLCDQVLEPMRDKFGSCHVNSGYRHTRYNAGIGGASRSFHIYDLRPDQPAADVRFARGTPAQWAAFARRLGKGGVGQYNRAGFVHVDLGPRRDWSG